MKAYELLIGKTFETLETIGGVPTGRHPILSLPERYIILEARLDENNPEHSVFSVKYALGAKSEIPVHLVLGHKLVDESGQRLLEETTVEQSLPKCTTPNLNYPRNSENESVALENYDSNSFID